MARKRWPFSLRSIRSRVRASLAVWIALLTIIAAYGFAPVIVDTLHLREVAVNEAAVYKPVRQTIALLQAERRLSVRAVVDTDANRRALKKTREGLDGAVEAFTALQDRDMVQKVSTEMKTALTKLDTLNTERVRVSERTAGSFEIATSYTEMLGSVLSVFRALASVTELAIDADQYTLFALQDLCETIGQEDAFLYEPLTRGTLTQRERHKMAELVGAREFLTAKTEAHMSDSSLKRFTEITHSAGFEKIQDIEREVTETDHRNSTLTHSADMWETSRSSVEENLTGLQGSMARAMIQRGKDSAISTFLTTVLLALAVLLVSVFLMVVWFRVLPRHVLRQLNGLKEAAQDFAHTRLPSVVKKLQRGERVDARSEVPPLPANSDEFGEVSLAFNSSREVAVQAAVDQAELRHSVREMFVNLARRSQGLVRRQLSLLDAMERETRDPDELERLFSLDHLATRLRRHSEDLVILSGGSPGRQWRKSVAMVDVIRSAIGEVEAYQRINIVQIDEGHLAGRAVADVIPLLSALLDNATTYSPPPTKVSVTGMEVPNGFVVEIEDSGLGMSHEELARINERLASPPEDQVLDAVQLGFFVVTQLAHRHNIRVTLRKSPYGGTTAIVLLPNSIVEPLVESELRITRDIKEQPQMHSSVSLPVASQQIAEEKWRPLPAPHPRRKTSRHEASPSPSSSLTPSPSPKPATNGAERSLPSLPQRQRQTSLVAELRRENHEKSTRVDEDSFSERSPEQLREMMSKFQRGFAQGSKDADTLGLPEVYESGMDVSGIGEDDSLTHTYSEK